MCTEGRYGAYPRRYGRGRCDCSGDTCLLLHDVRTDEDPDRPDCGAVYEDHQQGVLFIVSAADSSKAAMERTIEGFRAFTSCLQGAKEKGIIYGTGAWEIGDIQGSRAMKQAYEMGRAS